MKANKYIAGFLALFAAQSASADTFHVTGATAFRRATIEAVHAIFNNDPLDAVFSYASNKSGTDYINADFITFKGTLTGLGATTIRCSFNGSIEGLRALAEPGQSGIPGTDGNPYFIKDSSVEVTATVSGAGQTISGISTSTPGTSTHVDRGVADMAFSDTDKAISPYISAPMSAPLDSPASLVFALVNSDGGGITNVTTQQYNSLLSNGIVQKSFFTGLTADQTKKVVCTGRNDGSGTRSSYLAEMGFGVSNPVNQYLVVSATGATSDQIKAIQQVPAAGTNDTDSGTAGVQLPVSDLKTFDEAGANAQARVTQLETSASTVWGQSVNGNGGAFSGSVLRDHLIRKGASVRFFDAAGAGLYENVPQTNVSLISWISLNDAITARSGGATICAFNGVSIDVNGAGNTLTDLDKFKIFRGAYTAWNRQQFYILDSKLATATETIYTSIWNSVANGNLGAAGLKNTDFTIGRTEDGGTINVVD